MNNNSSRPNLSQKPIQFLKQGNKVSPTAKQQINFQLITNHYQSKDFHFRRYPFQSYHNQSNTLLKTTLSRKIEKLQLQKLINITHPNLINIRKIIRGHPKEYNNTLLHDYFTFYYENVIYSLRRVASMTESSPQMMKNIQNINFKNILSNLTQYLLDNDINHKISLDDIGINNSLEIKIYLSPAIACSLEKEEITHTEIYKNNQNLINWWKTTFSMAEQKSDYFDIQQRYSFCDAEYKFNGYNKSNKSSCIIQEDCEDESNIKHETIQKFGQDKFRPLSFSIDRHYQPLTSSIQRHIASKSKDKAQELKYSQRTLASNTNPLQKAKIKKIHQQIQNIKKKIYKTSFDYRFRKQSDDLILAKKNATNKLNYQKQVFQSAKFQTNKHHQLPYPQVNKYKYEPIQQNINCINIYNQSPSKNKILKPAASYNIIPLAKNRQNGNHNSHGHIEIANYRSNTNSQSNDSFHIQENILPNSFYRHTLEPKEGRPLINFKHNDKTSYPQSNQVKVTNKNITESAGPLQFKNIINKVIKPQFLSKKSNIYEDPFEDESEHSLPRQEPIKQQKNEIEYLRKLLKQNMKDAGLKNVASRQQRVNNPRNEIQAQSIQKIHVSNNKAQSNLFKKCKKMQVLNLRIKQVLLKSKNAIQLLNQGKNNNKRCLSPQIPTYIRYKE